MVMKIRILDDIYWYTIYGKLSKILPDFEYPVKDNVMSPIPFLSEIKSWDIILLDNYFPWDYWESPLWDDFLWQYLKLNLHCKIVCLSNLWERIVQRFEQWCRVYTQWDVIGFVPNKDAKEIAEILMLN